MAEQVNCSFGSQTSQCGMVGSGSSIVPLDACNHDVTSHLLSLMVTSKRGRGKSLLTEKDLILNRAGVFHRTESEITAMTVCPKHRKSLTTDWEGRKSRSCLHPNHKGQRKQMKSPRRVNATMSEEIFDLHKEVVPIGAGKYTLYL